MDRNPVPDPSSRIRFEGIKGAEIRYWDRWRDASQVFRPVVPEAERRLRDSRRVIVGGTSVEEVEVGVVGGVISGDLGDVGNGDLELEKLGRREDRVYVT